MFLGRGKLLGVGNTPQKFLQSSFCSAEQNLARAEVSKLDGYMVQLYARPTETASGTFHSYRHSLNECCDTSTEGTEFN